MSLDLQITELKRSVWALKEGLSTRIGDDKWADKMRSPTWTLSLDGVIHESKDEKARLDRQSRERKFEINVLQLRLCLEEAQLQKREKLLKVSKEANDAADFINNQKIRAAEIRVWQRTFEEERERWDRQRWA